MVARVLLEDRMPVGPLDSPGMVDSGLEGAHSVEFLLLGFGMQGGTELKRQKERGLMRGFRRS